MIICPKCGSKALNIGLSYTTLMMYQHFTDEEGKEHFHDPNTTTTRYTCIKCGHSFSEESRHKCWCEK